MRKLTYLLVLFALGLASCGQKGYQITGTMEDAADGDTVYLMKRENRQFVPVDTAVIADGKFVFTGVQDTVVNRYIRYKAEGSDRPVYLDFFLENGKIQIQMVKAMGGDVVSGTPTNNAYQEFKNKLHVVEQKLMALGEERQSATDERKAEIAKEAAAAEDEYTNVIKSSIEQNIANPLGTYLISSNYYYYEYPELGEVIAKLPASAQTDPNIARLSELVETARKTAVGQPFVDFEMKDPKGNPVKLSDFAGKGKLVLVDFWASWCGPCREEMPNLVAAYAKYKDKGFEIVGVSLDRTAEAWQKGIEQLSITWPQMSDLEYWNSLGAKLYAVSSIPHVVLIDGEGTIVARGLHGEKLQEKLAELLDK